MLNTPSELSNDETNTDDLEETTDELEESTDALQDEEELDEGEDDSEDDENEDETFVIGDNEITLAEFEQMKKNQMLQADYTKKRQAEAGQLKSKMAEIDALLEQADTLESFVDEDESSVDWDDFVSTSEMKKAEAKFKARRSKIKEIRDAATKQKQDISGTTIEATNKAVFDHFTDWSGNQKQADADRKLAYEYAQSIGYTDEALNSIDNPQAFISLIEAARMKKELEEIKNAKPEKKLKRKTPKTVKSQKKKAAKSKSWADVFYGSS